MHSAGQEAWMADKALLRADALSVSHIVSGMTVPVNGIH